MTKHDYTALDAAILAQIEHGKTPDGRIHFGDIFESDEVKAQAKKLQAAESKKDAFRFVDSRLQALRKAGRIEHRGPKEGWHLKKS